MKTNNSNKTPLRYPGGKSRATKFLFSLENMPNRHIAEYREPFIGGGSPAIAFAKKYPSVPIWINDKYYNLYAFWKTLQEHGDLLHEKVREEKQNALQGGTGSAREIFNRCKSEINQCTDMLEIAWRFYIINKCSFSGLTESSSFSQMSSDANWTLSNIDSLPFYSRLISKWKITNLDYTELLSNDPSVFVFLDPPYDLKKDYTLSGADGENLYGVKGSMHKGFNHVEFAENLNKHKSMMMVTYNSNPNIRKLFEGWEQTEWDLAYTMRSTGTYRDDQKNRKELLCMNYKTNSQSTLEDFFT